MRARAPGIWSKRGSIVALGERHDSVDLPVRLHLPAAPPAAHAHSGSATRYGLPVGERHLTGFYRRYSGDLADLGKGRDSRMDAE